MRFQTTSKSILLTAAIALISYGLRLLETNLLMAVCLILLGLALVVVYTYLLEFQSAMRAVFELAKLRRVRDDEQRGEG